MRECVDKMMAVLRPESFRGAPGLVFALLVLVGCDEMAHQKTMEFFFDGVPPLPGELSDSGPFDPNEPGGAGPLATGGWHVHEPLKDCTECHASRRRARFSREVQLVAEVPRLCFKCHDEYAALSGWVHGPVATGDCAFCHEPHKTQNAFLLTGPVPDLCYRCHDREALDLIPRHTEPSYKRCIECHAGHAGITRYLLRPEFLESEAGRAYRSQAYRQQYERALRRARSDLAQGRGVSALLRTAAEHIEGGRLWEARATLEAITDSETLSDDGRQSLTAILQRVMALLESESDTSAESPPETGRVELSAALETVQKQRSRRQIALADLYYRSVQAYHAGRLVEARAGFIELLRSDALLGPVRQTAQRYLGVIDQAMSPTQDEEPLQPEP